MDKEMLKADEKEKRAPLGPGVYSDLEYECGEGALQRRLNNKKKNFKQRPLLSRLSVKLKEEVVIGADRARKKEKPLVLRGLL